jgi:hypothetical protein
MPTPLPSFAGHSPRNAPEVSLSGSNAAFPAQGGQAIASYTTTMSQWAIDAGITWRP